MGNRSARQVVVMVLGAVIMLAGVGVVAVVKMMPQPPDQQGQERVQCTSMLSIGELVVNLADEDVVRYLKTDIVLELRGKLSDEVEKDARARMRDASIDILSKKAFSDLMRAESKEAVKTEILAAAEQRIPNVKIENVYFNEFAMQ